MLWTGEVQQPKLSKGALGKLIVILWVTRKPFHVHGSVVKVRDYVFEKFPPSIWTINVMATLGPGWQMLDSFGFWWTWVNEIRNLSSFLQGGLNGGVRFYPTWYFALKNGIFQVKCRCHYAKKLVSWARDFKFWLQPCFFEPVKSRKYQVG